MSSIYPLLSSSIPFDGISLVFTQATSFKSSCNKSVPESTTPTTTSTPFLPCKKA